VSGHPDLRPLIDGADLERSNREALLAHLEGCAACRAELAAEDPSLLFTLLATEPVPAGVLEQVSERTAAALAAERTPRRLPGWAWGALAASILTAGLFVTYVNRPAVEVPPPLPGPASAQAPPPPPAAIPAGMIEVLDSPGEANVVEMTVGDVEVVMIFDEELGI
jgi:anti-sigma factor RsiW